MKISDVKQIIDISEEEWIYFSRLINQNVKKDLMSRLIFLNQNEILQTVSMYSLYPLMFRKEFKFDKEKIENLIVFSHNHFTSLFILDKIYDSQSIEEPTDLLILLEQYSENMSFLNSLKNKNDDNILGNIRKTLDGLYKEKYIYKYNQILPLEEEAQYAYEKYSFAKVALKIYQNSADNYLPNETMNELYRSHDYFAYGRQILDDLEDFKKDFENMQFNIYNNRYFIKYGNKSLPILDESLFLELLVEAKKYFNSALESLSCKFDYWANYICFYLKICEKYID